ncbi:MAG: BrnT family toxin [Gemmatimonadetes bacterium]|nr:BrnT family toxin [Gemmatimonadota bacterium]
MLFEWDHQKSDANLEERGFDFAFATLVFDGPTPEKRDTRRDYGEQRVLAVGAADGIHLTVVYTDRAARTGTVRRIISARRSDQREREAYREAIQR